VRVGTRLRYSALLCTHFIRNLAYYRGGWNGTRIAFPRTEIWATINSNFLDVAVLEWCKLFADKSARHHWRKVVVDPNFFLPQMLSDSGISQPDWVSYLEKMREYRDKFVAHLDDRLVMNIPQMSLAQTATYYFYDTIRAEHSADVFQDLPTSLRAYAQRCRLQAKQVYANAA
jgi:hypothetical protein